MTSPFHTVRKRRRPAYSCLECRRRKVRCDRGMPCRQCSAHNNAYLCTYEENRRTLPAHEASSTGSDRQQEDRTHCDPDRPRHTDLSPHASTQTSFLGTVSKTRVFGYGHWMASASLIEELSILQPIGDYYDKVFKQDNHSLADEVAKTVAQCKQLARDVKRQRPSRRSLPAGIYRSFPDRQVMDELVELYFNTFESCYRILFLPSFMAEYVSCMDHGESVESSFLLQLLLVMTAAGTLHGDVYIRSEVAAKAQVWIHISQTWLSAPLEKSRLTLKGIQVQCLLLLCRQLCQVGADLVWISAGSLLRMAMHMGLHQDPNNLGEMSVQEKEIRRRLWYTILELNVQAALDSGMSPMVSDGDYNTNPPSNMSDKDLDNAVREDELLNNSTQTSLQSLLSKSIPLRLKVTRVINSLQEEPSYDDILAIGNELALACRDVTTAIDQAASISDAHSARSFAQSYSSHLLRRFPLCLHFRYAIKAKKNPLYSHSQRVCLEAALDIVSLLEDDLYSRLLLTGSGMFRDIITRSALLIFLELSPDPEVESSIYWKKRNRARQNLLIQDARRVVQYAEDRIRHGETNVKTYAFLRMMLVQAEGRLNGSLTEEDLTKSLHEGLNTYHQILQDMAADTSNYDHNTVYSDIGLGSWTSNGMNASSQACFETDTFEFIDDIDVDLDFWNSQFPPQWAG